VTKEASAGILHVDMDAFFASVELLDFPEFRGKPAVVAPLSGRSVVLSATYEARALGIKGPMPLSIAQRLVPDLIVMPPHREKYTAASAQVMAVFHDFTPVVEPLSIDEAFLDVRGALRLLGSPAQIAQDIREAVFRRTGLSCSVGVGATKFIAKLASAACKPNGLLVVEPENTLTFLHPLPIRALWGVGPQTAKVLERRGLHTVGDIAETPERSLISALGESAGRHLYELSWGRDPRSVMPDRAAKGMGREITFDEDVRDLDTLRRTLLAHSERVGAQLRESGLDARTIAIKLTSPDRSSVSRSRTLSSPSSVSRQIYATAVELLDILLEEMGGIGIVPVRLIGVRAEQLMPAGSSDGLLWDADEEWRELEKVEDAVTKKFGRGVIKPASLVTGSGESEFGQSAHGATKGLPE
jgi:DNA polymerase-4